MILSVHGKGCFCLNTLNLRVLFWICQLKMPLLII
jgi:hypothetical protein